MRRIVLFLVGIVLLALPSLAAPSVVGYSMDRVSIRGCGDSLSVKIAWSFNGRIDDGSAFIVRPVLRGSLGEVALSPVVVYGRKLFYGMDVASGDERENAFLFEGEKLSVSCEDMLPYESWMDTVRLSLTAYDWTKRTGAFLVSASQRSVYTKPGRPEKPAFPWTMRDPGKGSEETRTVVLSCSVAFVEKSSRFDIEEGDNLEEVTGFIRKVRSIAGSKLFSVRASSLSVSVPPEGNNVVSRKRSAACAQSLFTYMQRAGVFRYSVPQRKGAGEDWDGLREWIDRSEYCDDERIHEILSWEGREDEMYSTLSREKPVAWEAISARCLPGLGRAEYSVSFKPLEFSRPNFVMPVFEEVPEALSPHDFFYLAGLYEEGSDQWLEVICEGAQLNPLSEELNMDAAMGHVLAGNTRAAVPYLRHIGQSDAGKYVYALWLFSSERYAEALDILHHLSDRDSIYQEVWNEVAPYSVWVMNRCDWEILR